MKALSGSAPMLIVFVLMIAFMYFGMIRPQKKQQEKQRQMINEMKKGDKIVTIGGLHGVIDSVNRENATVDIDVDGVYLTFDLRAIRVVSSAPGSSVEASDEETPATDQADDGAEEANDSDTVTDGAEKDDKQD